MEVESSSIQMGSKYKFHKERTRKESMKVWVRKNPRQRKKGDKVDISPQARKKMAAEEEGAVEGEEIKFEMSEEDKHKIMLLEKFLEDFLGKEIEFKIPEKIEITGDKIVISLADGENNNQAEEEPNWAVEYKYEETYLEQEKMSFRAKGKITTGQGEKIKFSLKLKLNREFFRRESFSLQAGNKKLIDPLAVNLTTDSAELTAEKFSFDLNSDQQEEEISFLKPGSGFLALDKNKDGKINDGTELFGPTSGDGFGELAEYDKNGDGWIDEQDPIFTELKIWTKDKEGNDRLSLLAEKGVGAIYLDKVDSLFSLKGGDNSLKGRIEETGIYIKETKEAGTIQKINLAG